MNRTVGNTEEAQAAVEKIASQMYSTLARAFPVCCASDEFYYFPQIHLDDADWSAWDDFSPERINEIKG